MCPYSVLVVFLLIKIIATPDIIIAPPKYAYVFGVSLRINIDVSKQFQSSDFGGELTPAQLKYCANDVIYLHRIHDELKKILERENRIQLYEDCLKFLKTRVDLDLALFRDDIWSH